MKFKTGLISASLFIVLLFTTAFAGWAQNTPPAPAQNNGMTEQDIPPGGADPAAGNLAPVPDNTAPAQNNTAPAQNNAAPAQNNAAPAQNNAAPEPSAQPDQNLPQEVSPQNDPSSRVGRLEYMSGSISVQPGGTGDWIEGSSNRPLTNGDNIWADKDSRAEISVGTGVLRIDSESSLTLTNVANDVVQASLHQGTLNLHIRHLYEGEVYEIDTPNLAFTVRKSGDYRFDLDPNGDTTMVTVRRGEGAATGQGPAVVIEAGQQARFSNGTSLTHQIQNAPRPDGFDDWCRLRDQHEDNSMSSKYVAPGVVGSEDLDDNGTWQNTPDYGEVWEPNGVAPGWTPYSAGDWIWENPWGWTWVDAYPWGFAPFHYGRWVNWGGVWGWAPGPYWARPWYAPALVGWFGGPRWGFGFGFGVGFGGGFGWCPLGWGEPFYPWYGASRGYFRNVNISNTRITNINHITNNYYNHGVRSYAGRQGSLPRYASSAGRAMSRSNFASGRSVAGNSVKLTSTSLRGASTMSRPNATPTAQSRVGASARPASVRPSASTFSRPTVSHLTPPARSSTMGRASTGRAPTESARSTTATAPRNNGASGNRPSGTRPGGASAGGRYIPRPPQSSMESRNSARTSQPSTMSRSVPRPPESSSVNRPSAMGNERSARPENTEPRSYGGSNSARNVPRPTGPVRPAPREYTSPENGNRGNYSSRAYQGGRGFEEGRSYEGNSSRAYGGYGGYRGYTPHPTYDSPYGGRSYGGNGRSFSPPSRSFGGGSHAGSAPHGSFGGHSSGSHSSGGHSGGGGHGGRR